MRLGKKGLIYPKFEQTVTVDEPTETTPMNVYIQELHTGEILEWAVTDDPDAIKLHNGPANVIKKYIEDGQFEVSVMVLDHGMYHPIDTLNYHEILSTIASLLESKQNLPSVDPNTMEWIFENKHIVSDLINITNIPYVDAVFVVDDCGCLQRCDYINIQDTNELLVALQRSWKRYSNAKNRIGKAGESPVSSLAALTNSIYEDYKPGHATVLNLDRQAKLNRLEQVNAANDVSDEFPGELKVDLHRDIDNKGHFSDPEKIEKITQKFNVNAFVRKKYERNLV